MANSERLTAEERSEAILRAATIEFAAYGFHGASTQAIAKRVEISQPYIFKLFGTKKELYLATLERVYDRVQATFQQAAADATTSSCDSLDAMGQAYVRMLDERADLQLILQGFASAQDPEIRQFVRERYTDIFHFVEETAGVSNVEARNFMATGLLLTVMAVADIPKEVFYPEDKITSF